MAKVLRLNPPRYKRNEPSRGYFFSRSKEFESAIKAGRYKEITARSMNTKDLRKKVGDEWYKLHKQGIYKVPKSYLKAKTTGKGEKKRVVRKEVPAYYGDYKQWKEKRPVSDKVRKGRAVPLFKEAAKIIKKMKAGGRKIGKTARREAFREAKKNLGWTKVAPKKTMAKKSTEKKISSTPARRRTAPKRTAVKKKNFFTESGQKEYRSIKSPASKARRIQVRAGELRKSGVMSDKDFNSISRIAKKYRKEDPKRHIGYEGYLKDQGYERYNPWFPNVSNVVAGLNGMVGLSSTVALSAWMEKAVYENTKVNDWIVKNIQNNNARLVASEVVPVASVVASMSIGLTAASFITNMFSKGAAREYVSNAALQTGVAIAGVGKIIPRFMNIWKNWGKTWTKPVALGDYLTVPRRGMSDYLTVPRRGMSDYLTVPRKGMSDYLTIPDKNYTPSYMSDYLTVPDANYRPSYMGQYLSVPRHRSRSLGNLSKKYEGQLMDNYKRTAVAPWMPKSYFR